MKRNFKRVMSLLLTVLMVLTAVPFAGAVVEECEHTYTYTYYKNDKHIKECSKCGDADFVGCNGGTATCKDLAVCKDCGHTYGELSATHGETKVVIGEDNLKSEATCISPAIYYYVCKLCNSNVADTFEFGDVDADAHEFESAGANEENPGTHSATCIHCEDTFDDLECECAEPEVVDPTCTTGGKTLNVCDYCEYEWDSDPVDALGHTYTEEIKDEAHLKSAATCTAKATYWYDCASDDCNVNAKDDAEATDAYYETGEMLDHVYDQSVVDDEYLKSGATCQAKSVYYKSCICGLSSEGKAEEATFEGALGTHSMGAYEYNNDARCGVDGTETSRCTITGCTESHTRTKAGTALQHSFTEEIADQAHLKSAATCTKKATYWKECANTDCTVKASDETVAANYFESGDFAAHSWNEGSVKIPATCMTAGVMIFTCTTCPQATAKTKEEPIAVDVNAHAWGDWEATAEDKHERVCANNAVHKETADCSGGTATCTAKAVCSVCEDTYGELAPHAYTQELADDAHKISDATCIAKATYWKDCANCDANAKLADKTGMTEAEIAALTFEAGELKAHKYEKKVAEDAYIVEGFAATCTTNAKYWYGCTQEGCTAMAKDDATAQDKYYEAANTATGHSTIKIEGLEPTCEKDGYTESIRCEKCGVFTKEAVKRPATGHKEVIVVEKQDATCTKVGHTEEKKCAVCEKALTLPSSTIAALGHIDANGDDICDRENCHTILEEGVKCNCMCHQTGIMRVIYVIVRFFWKMLGSNQYCDCGVEHY